MMQSSTQRIELIARSFADGVKDLFECILATICEYQDQERIVKLRGEFIPMNPRQWTSHYDCTTQVGLGTGNQDQRLEVLQQVLNVQEKMIQQQGGMGMVTPQTIYNTIEAYLQNSGYKDATQFFNDPSQQPPQPPQQEQPDPALQLAAQDIEMRKQKAMADADFKNRKLEADNEFKMQKLNLDEQKLATQVVKEQNVSQLEKEKLASKILQQGMN